MNDLFALYSKLPSRPRSPQAVPKPYRFLRLCDPVDVTRVADEVARAEIPWTSAPWKWHHETLVAVLRAGDPQHGAQALVAGVGVDQPILSQLPELRRFLDEAFSNPAPMAWLGLSPPGSHIYLHGDNTEHWDEHHRVHVPLVTNPDAKICVAGQFQHFGPGWVWAFNNTKIHGAINHGTQDRIHLVVDLGRSAETETLLQKATPYEGAVEPGLLSELQRDPLDTLHAGHIKDSELIERLKAQ